MGALPLEVKLDTWEINPGVQQSWKKLACRVSAGIFFAHTLYKNLSLLCALVFAWHTPLHQMVIHIILAATSAMYSFWYYILYIRYPGTFATYATMTLRATVTESKCIQTQFLFTSEK